MLCHIVLLKLRKTISDSDVNEFYTAINRLSDIDGVVSVHCGPHASMYEGYAHRNKEFTHALVVILKDKEYLRLYDLSPLHQQVKKQHIVPNLDNSVQDPILALDYEFDNKIHYRTNRMGSLQNMSWIAAFIVIAASGCLLWKRSRL